ncbi:MAG: hypothetical protein IPL46_18505 [Saprospiraceae bacterium]|nr:hypothetical protein [Saprospiraceae bacterium]
MNGRENLFRERVSQGKYLLYLIFAVWLLLELIGPSILSTVKGDHLSKKGLLNSLISDVDIENDSSRNLSGRRTTDSLLLKPYALHPYIGYIFDRDQDSTINNAGFRGPSPLTKKATGHFKICITGGSVALQTFSMRGSLIKELQKSTYFREKKIEVVNLALGGYKQPQQLMALTYHLFLGAEYDMVINLDGFNEMALPYTAAKHSNHYPFFPRNWEKNAANIPDPTLYRKWSALSLAMERRNSLKQRHSRSLFKYSYVALLFGHAQLASMNEQVKDLNDQINTEIRNLDDSFQSLGPPYDFSNEQVFLKDLAEKWKNASFQMHNICRANGIRYFHFLQPNQYVAGSKVLTDEENRIANMDIYPEKKNATYHYSQAVKRGYSYLIEEGRELKDLVPFWDLTMIFSDEKNSVYTDFCCHFNQYGVVEINRRIAGIIIDYIPQDGR